ncbi:GGDEF domain-containing protein [Oribacterium sp. oral taxon 102]|uniref:bifunctional diguanylate cyclase/phosphodiesterase n=1 Tax=Oribacterium sp. oral taxon 102 TaxID=671214 RepID=UPI0015BEB2C6|nr:bifunctional diguanylate cyclase/phosphodiesterase [Oribacterium sp. oral taxon 102]NWO22069.1 GGDEF domain-containing protein [Oribacterium sp. oral taxon 102]
MKHHEKYHNISDILISIGILLFFLFLLFLLRFWNEEIRTKNTAQTQITDTVSPEEGQEKYQFCFLSSYSASFGTFMPQLEGIRSMLDAHQIKLDNFSMNSKKFDSEGDYLAFFYYMQALLKQRKPYDAILVGDDAALEFTMKYQEELFPHTPIVFFAVNNQETAELAAQNDYICGYVEPYFLENTIAAAMKLQPEADKLICIYDDSLTGVADRQNFYALETKFPSLRFGGLDFSNYTPAELRNILSGLDKTTILLYLSAFRDKDGRNYTIPESVALITGASGTPVYHDGYGGFGDGITGGRQLDYAKLASNAAYAAVEIVEKGIPTKDIRLSASAPGTFIFDYKALVKYGLNRRKVPRNAVILHAPGEGMMLYLRIFGIMLLLAASLACFWANASINRWLSERTAEELKASNQGLLALQQELQYEASHDNMTKLMNRHTVVQYLQTRLPMEKQYSAVLMDVDNLKEINESHGHEVGDDYLGKLGQMLREYSYSHKVVAARFGGDAFLIVYLGRVLTQDSEEIQDINHIFKQSIEVGTGKILMSASGGVATSETASGVRVVMDADTAAAEAKRNGKNQIIFYSDKLREKTERDNELRKLVQDAVLEENLYMVYQPQVDCLSGRVSGYEALVRIRGEAVSPGIFIPIAERYGYISTIGRMTTRMVIRQLARWRNEGTALRPISVNFSSYQLNDLGYVDYVFELLEQYRIAAKYLVLEVTESILLEETEHSREMFRRLTEAGICIHLDDFGTGYSSFGYLSYIPISALKIDKTLVDRYLVDNEDLLASLINTIHYLGKRVIVEGVEQRWQYERLHALSCDTIQGYYFSRPEEPEKIRDWEPEEPKISIVPVDGTRAL